MKVRNIQRTMVAKGIELDRDIYPGEVTQVKPGYEQSERIVAMLTPNAQGKAALEAIDVSAVAVEGGIVAVQPGVEKPLAEFGEPLELPKRVRDAFKAEEEYRKLAEEPLEEPPVNQDKLEEAITSQLLDEDQKENLLEDTVPPVSADTDELAEFSRRNGGARTKYVAKMTDVAALRSALETVKVGSKTYEVVEARIAELCHVPEQS